MKRAAVLCALALFGCLPVARRTPPPKAGPSLGQRLKQERERLEQAKVMTEPVRTATLKGVFGASYGLLLEAKRDRDPLLIKKAWYIGRHVFVELYGADLSPEHRRAVLSGQILLGMSEDSVMAVMGLPEHENVTTTRRGQRKQWVYRAQKKYVYFDGGQLTAVQERQ